MWRPEPVELRKSHWTCGSRWREPLWFGVAEGEAELNRFKPQQQSRLSTSQVRSVEETEETDALLSSGEPALGRGKISRDQVIVC